MQGVVHNGGKIIIINEFFGVAHFLEAFKDGVDFLFREDMAQLFQPGFDGSASGMLGEREFRGSPADRLRVHDFIGLPAVEDAVLVDA